MKLLKPVHFILPVLLCSLLVFTGCQDKSAMLAKTWKIHDLKYKSEIPAGLKPTIQESIDKIKRSYSITYEPTGRYYTSMEGQSAKGRWKLNMNSTVITSTSDEGIKTEFKIIELSPDKFTFEAMEGKSLVIFEMVPAK